MNDPVIVNWNISIGLVGAVREGTWKIDREEWNGLTTEGREALLDEMYGEAVSTYMDGGWSVENADLDDPTT